MLFATPMHYLFKEIVNNDILHATARDGIISLLNKPDKNLLKIPNWRPLTLLNADYKVFAKVLANRLQQVLPYVIHHDQSGYMKGRSISNNLLDLLSIIEHCSERKLEALIISVDFKRAYDSVSWKSLEAILVAFGFGPQFIKMVFICYRNIRSAVINNGRWSDWFQVGCGLKQGCVLSCFIFILITEVIAIRIRNNQDIRGVQIHNIEKKIGQYVDDLWNVISFELSSFQELLFEYSEFESFTGLSINYDKTEILCIGSLHGSDAKFYSTLPLKWSDGFIKILGVYFGPVLQRVLEINYNSILDKIKAICNSWNNRALSPIGKIQVINSLCNSQFVYKLQCLLSPPDDFFVQYERIIRDFIWDGKKPKVAYKKLILSYDKGGLQLRDLRLIDQSLKLAKFHNIESLDHFWTECIHNIFPLKKEWWLKLNFNTHDANRLIPTSFFRNMWRFWAQLNFVNPASVNDILQQLLWFNSHIKNKDKWLYNEHMFNAGICKVIDLFDLDTGKFYAYDDFVRMYGAIINFIDYYSIVHCIPKKWKDTLLKNEPSADISCTPTFAKSFCRVKTKPASFCYKFLRSALPSPLAALQTIWNNDLNLSISEKEMSAILRKINRVTGCTKLRYFQYRIITKSLITDTRVSIWDRSTSDKCTFCSEAKETVVHLFWDCKNSQKIWTAISKWMNYFFSVKIKFTAENVFLNNYNKRDSALINFVILVTKFFIYKSKVQGLMLNFSHLIKDLTRYQSIEKTIAFKNDKLYKYARKWDDFDVFL